MRGRHRAWLPALATFLVGLVLTAMLYAAVHALEEERQRAEFETVANARIDAVRAGLDNTLDVLGTVNRLFSTMQPVTRAQFTAFAAPMLERHLPVELIVWQSVVDDAARARFEESRRAELPGFAITEPAGAGLAPAARRPRYRVIDYLVPLAGNEGALGLDAGTRPEQAEAVLRACLSGQAAMTSQHQLLVGGASQPGFAILMPVYRAGQAAPGALRCAQVAGYTAVVFSSALLVRRTLAERGLLDPEAAAIRLYAAAAPDAKRLVFSQDAAARTAPSSFLDGQLPPAVARSFEVAGQAMHMVVTPPAPRVLRDHLGSLMALIGGIAGSMGAAAIASLLAARARAVHGMVEQRTEELSRATESLQLLQQAIEASVNSIVIARAEEPDYPIEYVNPAFERLNGYAGAEVMGKSFSLLWDQDLEQRGAVDVLALARERRGGNVLMRTLRKDGSQLWCEMYLSPCAGPDGAVRHYVVVQHDITEKRRYEGQLEYQATHDALTGLANRNLLRRRLVEEIAAARRSAQAVAVLSLDLDRFKQINDSLGHEGGDAFLRAIADRLQKTVRTGDMAARLTADEFVLVLPERTGKPLGGPALERIMGAIAQPVELNGQQFEISCSVGVAKYPTDGDDPDVLVDCANRAMRAAKQRGANQFQYFQAQLNEEVREHFDLERALRSALEREEFEIVYQPWADLVSGKLAGVRAQLRWSNPELGRIEAVRFLPIAEENGTSVAICSWLLERACKQVSSWHQAGLGELTLALGVGMPQLKEPGLLATVEEVLGASGLEPRLLRLELAESVVGGDAAQVLPVLNNLRALGIRLAIDRFGTGRATLADLRRFPIDVLHMDRSFAEELGRSAAAEAIPDAIISMAHSLGIRVLAEGVDTEQQCEIMSQNMCDEVQGALLAPPLGPEEAAALLAAGAGLPARLLRLHKRERTLLLVDDEPNILTALRRQMRSAKCRILTANSGQEGLDLLATEPVDVIVSDQRMPGMTGVEFLRAVKGSHPDTVRIVLSGFTELQSVTDAVNEGAIYKFLTKPWDDTQLRAHIEEAFRHKEMVDENRRLGLELRTVNTDLAAANRQLEDVLEQQREQIRRDGISLDIVREALQRLPMAIVALDEDRQVAYANLAARKLLGDSGTLLGSAAEDAMPSLASQLEGRPDGAVIDADVGGQLCEVVVYNMGRKTQSRGTMITLTPQAAGTGRGR